MSWTIVFFIQVPQTCHGPLFFHSSTSDMSWTIVFSFKYLRHVMGHCFFYNKYLIRKNMLFFLENIQFIRKFIYCAKDINFQRDNQINLDIIIIMLGNIGVKNRTERTTNMCFTSLNHRYYVVYQWIVSVILVFNTTYYFRL
jgi:hypothetical protein